MASTRDILDYSLAVHDGCITFQVLKQEKAFTEWLHGQNPRFRYNEWEVVSKGCPDIQLFPHRIYLRGIDTKRDTEKGVLENVKGALMMMQNIEMTLAECVREYQRMCLYQNPPGGTLEFFLEASREFVLFSVSWQHPLFACWCAKETRFSSVHISLRCVGTGATGWRLGNNGWKGCGSDEAGTRWVGVGDGTGVTSCCCIMESAEEAAKFVEDLKISLAEWAAEFQKDMRIKHSPAKDEELMCV